MGVIVREKNKGSGIYWVFINHEVRRRSIQASSAEVAEDVADVETPPALCMAS